MDYGGNFMGKYDLYLHAIFHIIFTLVLSVSGLSAQDFLLTTILNINSYPSPYISDWETNGSSLGSFTIINPTELPFSIYLDVQITMEQNGLVFTGRTDLFEMPPGTKVINNTNFLTFSDATFPNSSLKNKAVQTGRLPEGEYTICIRTFTNTGYQISMEQCRDFTILYPQPPHLITPEDHSLVNVSNSLPVFQWTPVIVPANFQIHYSFKIVELLPGQNPYQALRSNVPYFEKNDISNPSLLYPINALPLKEEKTYVWQVQALDQWGSPIAQNDGYSEIYTFTVSQPYFPIELLAPADNGRIKSHTPTFRWSLIPGLNDYFIRIVELPPGADPEKAIEYYPVYAGSVGMNKTTFTPEQMLSLTAGKTYIWQVTAINVLTRKTSGKSEIRKFTLSPLLLMNPVSNTQISMKRPEFQWVMYGEKNQYYDLRVVEVPDFIWSGTQTVSDKLQSGPFVFHNSSISGAEYNRGNNNKMEIPVYSPESDLDLQPMKRYAWQVFRKNSPNGSPQDSSDIGFFNFNPYQEGLASNINLNGKLYYKFSDVDMVSVFPLKNASIKFVIRYVVKNISNLGNRGAKAYTEIGGSYIFRDDDIYSDFKQSYPDHGKILGITTTDDEGNFTFSALLDAPTGLLQTNYSVGEAGGEQSSLIAGDLYREIFIEFSPPWSNYYTNPGKGIDIQPGESKTVNGQIAQIRDYSVSFKLMPVQGEQYKNQAKQDELESMDVYLLRKKRPSVVPMNEGIPRPTEPDTLHYFGLNYEVVARGTTGGTGANYGKVTFKRLIKNTGPNDTYYIYAESNPEQGKYYYKVPLQEFKFDIPNDIAIYSNEFSYEPIERTLYGYPQHPQIIGNVTRADNGLPLQDVKVEILDYALLWWSTERERVTDSQGKFRFSHLDNPLQNENDMITGPIRAIRLSKPGFITQTYDLQGKGPNGVLLQGERISGDYALKPAGIVRGTIVNEHGMGIPAKVRLGDGVEVDATIPGFLKPAVFEMSAVVGDFPQKLYVDAGPAFMKDTFEVVIDSPDKDLGKFTIKQKLHRILLTVKEQKSGVSPLAWPVVKEAKIQLNVGGQIMEKVTDQQGHAYFEFANDGTVFSGKILPPEGQMYEVTPFLLTNTVSKDYRQEMVAVKRATFAEGHVYVANESNPIAGARVYIQQGEHTQVIETTTNSDGHFKLINVPANKMVQIWAVKSSKDSTLVGDSLLVYTGQPGEGVKNLKLFLKVYEGMDITKLMGFPVEIKTLTESGNRIFISGSFRKFEENSVFAVDDNTYTPLNFDRVEIVPSPNQTSQMYGKTVPIAMPKELPLRTNSNELGIKIYKEFYGLLSDKKLGIHLNNRKEGLGVVQGKVFIKPESFGTNGVLQNFAGFYLGKPDNQGKINMTISAFIPISDFSMKTEEKGFNIVDENGQSILFNLNGFLARTDSSASFILGNTITLKTILHTNILSLNQPDLKINLGNLKLRRTGLEPAEGTNPIKMGLNNWTMEGSHWKFDNGRLLIDKGTLKTGGFDIPVDLFEIKPTEIGETAFRLTSMQLAGGIPITITGTPLLGYSPSEQDWFLNVSGQDGSAPYAAYLENLPGMNPGDKIFIDFFRMKSKESYFRLSPIANHPPVPIYTVGLLKPTPSNSFEVFDDYLVMPGLTITGVPKLTQSTSIKYSMAGGKLQFSMVPFAITFEDKGVLMYFATSTSLAATQKLDENGFRVRGRVEEPGIGFGLDAWLYRTPSVTKIEVETPNSPYSAATSYQKLAIGGMNSTYLDSVSGSMIPQNAASWDYLRFEGNLKGTPGILPGQNRMNFTVKGEIEASGQSLGIKNIPTPLGGMNWTYDFAHNRMVGNMNINQNIAGIHFTGAVQTLIDNMGWYFISGGKVKIPGIPEGNAGLLIGDYPGLPQEVKDIFAASSYSKKLPPGFQNNIHGFLMYGAAAIPVLVPSISVDVVVAQASFGLEAGADVKVWRGFQEDGTEYGIGALGFLHAYLTMDAITCTELSADARTEVSYTGYYQTSTGTFSLDGCAGFKLAGKVVQKGVGIGDFCTPPTVTVFDNSISFQALMHLDSNGKISFSFAKGTCSGN